MHGLTDITYRQPSRRNPDQNEGEILGEAPGINKMPISSLEAGFPSKESKDQNGDEGSEQNSTCWANFPPAEAPGALVDRDWVIG